MKPKKCNCSSNGHVQRLYFIEFARIIMIVMIFIHHVVNRYTTVANEKINELFGITNIRWYYGVEVFFVIGAFFLYRQITSGKEPYEIIKKYYFRLVPGLLFCFSLCVVFCDINFMHLPAQLLVLGGTSIHLPELGSGDWFIGAYFWLTCLLVGVFTMSRRSALIVLGLLLYFSICLYKYAPTTNSGPYFLRTYYSLVGTSMIRGLVCMGFGMFAGWLSEVITISQKRSSKVIGTLFEGWCLLMLFHVIIRAQYQQSYVESIITIALLLVAISQSWGYISTFFNRFRRIQYLSRYVFPSLIGHIFIVRLFDYHKRFGMNFEEALIYVLAGSVIMGVIEYHLVEKYITPKLKKYFSNEV